MKYVKEGVLKYFKISMKFLNISKGNILLCIPMCSRYLQRLEQLKYKPFGLFGRSQTIIQLCSALVK